MRLIGDEEPEAPYVGPSGRSYNFAGGGELAHVMDVRYLETQYPIERVK